jgi:hypothetical protein
MEEAGTECNGTTAGLGYLEVVWIVLGKSPPWPASLCPHYHAEGYGQSGLQIASNLRWRTFRYWAYRARVYETWGQVPLGEWHNSSTDFNLKPSQQRSFTSKQASSQLQDTIRNATLQAEIMYV